MGSEQQVATMDTVRDLSSALWSLRTSQEAARLLRTSLSLLRCFLFFDICYPHLNGPVQPSEGPGQQDGFRRRPPHTFWKSLSNVQQPGQPRTANLAQSIPPPMASLLPPRPRIPLPPPCPGVLPVPPEAEVGAPVPLPGHLLPLLLLAPHPQAVPRDGLPPAGAGRRRRRVRRPRLPSAGHCSLASWRFAAQV